MKNANHKTSQYTVFSISLSLPLVHVQPYPQHHPVLSGREIDSLGVGQSGDRIPVAATLPARVQTDHVAHPVSTGLFPGSKCPERGEKQFAPRNIHLLPLCAFMACQRANLNWPPSAEPRHTNLQGRIQQLTFWSPVLPDKLTALQLVKKDSAMYKTHRSITLFTKVHSLSLLIQSTPLHFLS